MNIRITVGEKFNFKIGEKYHITTFEDLGHRQIRTLYKNVIVIGVNSQSVHVKNTEENTPFGLFPTIPLSELESVEEAN